MQMSKGGPVSAELCSELAVAPMSITLETGKSLCKCLPTFIGETLSSS